MKTFSVRRLETVKTTAALYGTTCTIRPRPGQLIP
jgi:hypothetical protein